MAAPVAVFADPHGLDVTPGVEVLTAAGFDVRVIDSRDAVEVARVAEGATALITGYARVDADLLDKLPTVKIVATMSAGFDMVDLDAARERGVWVSNLPDASTQEVAVHALAMTLCVLRALPLADTIVRSGRWWQEMTEQLHHPRTLTLGLIGMGRIAQSFATVAEPLFGRIVGYDPYLPEEAWPKGVDRVELDELLETSNVVSLHVPLSEDTSNLIDAGRLAQMRRGSVLVNVSRGGLVDEDALVASIDEGHLFGAALDVLAQEPPPADSPLLTHRRVLLSPHTAYLSVESKIAYVRQPAENVVAWHRSGRPVSPVLDPTAGA